MFFRIACIGVVVAELFLNSGCAKKDVPSSMGMALGGGDLGCLDRAAESVPLYLAGKASDAQTGGVWDCAIQSLDLFVGRTRGENSGYYTPGELRAFLAKYFLTQAQISDGFLAEVMALKKALIGGKTDSLTVDEIKSVRSFLLIFKEQSLRLRSFMPLTIENARSRTYDEMGQASEALQQAAQALGKALENTGNPYAFDRMSELLRQLQGVMKTSQVFNRARENLPILRAVKGSVLGSEKDRIAGNEWSSLSSTLARAYGLYLKFNSLSAHSDSYILGSGREPFVQLIKEGLGLVEEAIARHPREQFTFEELDSLLETFFPAGFEISGAGTITLAHLQQFMRPLVLRVFAGADSGLKGRAAVGLTRPVIQRILEVLEHWAQGQQYLETIFSQSQKEAFSEQLFSRARLADPARRLNQVIAEERPFFLGEDTLISFTGSRVKEKVSLHNLSERNWMYELVRLVVRGYAEDSERAVNVDDSETKMTFEEFNRFCEDIRAVGVDIKYLDPNDHKVAQKRFREAALFTYSGNGDEFLSVTEGAQLLALMLSAKRLANQVHQFAIDAGCPVGEMDPFNYRLIDADCYRRTFFANAERFWGKMPNLLKYIKGLMPAQRQELKRAIEDGARKGGYSQEMMNSSDSEGFGMIGHYIEVIFARYDQDDSGVLDWDEAAQAFPIFKRSLREMTCQTGHCLDSDADLTAVFTYLLAHGHSPSTFQFIRWRYLPIFRGLFADRGQLAQIFALLGRPSP
ncbi:hypothetical protein WDW37_07735 [Bdellovibrionota bacterium FG-1]